MANSDRYFKIGSYGKRIHIFQRALGSSYIQVLCGLWDRTGNDMLEVEKPSEDQICKSCIERKAEFNNKEVKDEHYG